MKYANFGDLKGKCLIDVTRNGDESIDFKTGDGKTFRLLHFDDCCEHVTIADICGDLSDLVGHPILQAEENSSREPQSNAYPADFDPAHHESFTWTFYRIATIKGSVVIRWLGTSNGYYSESVSFVELQ